MVLLVEKMAGKDEEGGGASLCRGVYELRSVKDRHRRPFRAKQEGHMMQLSNKKTA